MRKRKMRGRNNEKKNGRGKRRWAYLFIFENEGSGVEELAHVGNDGILIRLA